VLYQPTVLADVTDDNPAAAREAFGPMASVLKFGTVDEALDLATSSDLGLSAQVWGNDAPSIQHLVQNLEAGAVRVNTYRAAHPTFAPCTHEAQRLRHRVRVRRRARVDGCPDPEPRQRRRGRGDHLDPSDASPSLDK